MSTVKPYKDRSESKRVQVEQMFDNIAHSYDRLNRILSFGIDRYWRRVAISYLKEGKPKNVLDVATGTGDFALEIIKRISPEHLVASDISNGMLDVFREKIKDRDLNLDIVCADSTALPFEDSSFDAVTVAFGVRNFQQLEKGLKEFNRVLSDDGIVVVLEFSKPRRFPVKQLYSFYSKTVMPWVGSLLSKDRSAYEYLPDSVANFHDGEQFISKLKECGFSSVIERRLTMGIVTVYIAKK